MENGYLQQKKKKQKMTQHTMKNRLRSKNALKRKDMEMKTTTIEKNQHRHVLKDMVNYAIQRQMTTK